MQTSTEKLRLRRSAVQNSADSNADTLLSRCNPRRTFCFRSSAFVLMSDGSPSEALSPDEGAGGSPEQLTEAAKKRFAGTGIALKQIKKEEQRSKKRDTGVAQTIAQFLTDDQRAHLSVLIARLVARNCPSSFILALLALINASCREKSEEFLEETHKKTLDAAAEENFSVLARGSLSREANRSLVTWITRLQSILVIESNEIIASLLVDEKNMDGTVLQLSAFILQEFFEKQKLHPTFDELHTLSGNILHSVFAPFIQKKMKLKKNEDEEV